LLICRQIGQKTGSLDGGATVQKFEDDALLVGPDGDFFCVVAAVVVEFVGYADSV